MDDRQRHVTAIRMAADVEIRDAVCLEDPDFTNGDVGLTSEEIAYFKETGYLVKRGFLDEPEAFRQICECIWENVPRGLFSEGDRDSWVGAPSDAWTDEDVEQVGPIQGGSWKMRSREGIGTEPFFLDQIANHPRMREQAALFIGEPVKQAERVRGVYCQFPKSPDLPGKLQPHADYTAAHLTAMVLVDDIPPKCGGFTIWPGTHRRLHKYWETVQSGKISRDQEEAYARDRDDCVREITPVEFPGHAGDVVFWHPRLLHSAGINYSAEFDRQILRKVVPCDYQIDGKDFYDDLVHGPGPNHQWWVDTRNFHGDTPTTEDNLWDDWAFTQS